METYVVEGGSQCCISMQGQNWPQASVGSESSISSSVVDLVSAILRHIWVDQIIFVVLVNLGRTSLVKHSLLFPPCTETVRGPSYWLSGFSHHPIDKAFCIALHCIAPLLLAFDLIFFRCIGETISLDSNIISIWVRGLWSSCFCSANFFLVRYISFMVLMVDCKILRELV